MLNAKENHSARQNTISEQYFLASNVPSVKSRQNGTQNGNSK